MEARTFVVAESYVNATTETRFGDSGWQEAWTDDPGAIYRSAQREFGRCVSHVYQEFGGVVYAVGWVFQGRDTYDDYRSGLRPGRGDSTYLREVWVSCGLRDEDGAVYAYDVKRKRPVPLPGEAA